MVEPYRFGYNLLDYEGNHQYRYENSDHQNTKTGTYGYRDVNGIFRHWTPTNQERPPRTRPTQSSTRLQSMFYQSERPATSSRLKIFGIRVSATPSDAALAPKVVLVLRRDREGRGARTGKGGVLPLKNRRISINSHLYSNSRSP
ncbi:hypothetical protein HPB48_019950 [Haemaphysalis longicornis]|uniref:Uncharacterized protein n=1 Tax=Haemaphysalis longicornis TaxID=44386 RepID=A0A9J6FZP1_HAELO|nr:hypothetical protein HPB48_019950 [Haemaphysalis longicornis]